MSDIKLFRYSNDHAEELAGHSALVERRLHDLIEKHMECFLGIRFVAHEYSTGTKHRGRIDSLGLDENCCPVIIEYKRHVNENIINQGLYYLDWLLDHQAEFKLQIMDRFGSDVADDIEWRGARVLCVAGDFTKFDEHAVAQIGRNIELIRYKYFSDDLLLLEWLNPVRTDGTADRNATRTTTESDHEPSDDAAHLTSKMVGKSALCSLSSDMLPLFDEIKSFMFSMGDDINFKHLRFYFAFTRLRNFVCIEPYKSLLKVFLKLNPDSVSLDDGFFRDMRTTGHHATGDLMFQCRTMADIEKAKPLIERAYQEN